MVVIKVVLWVTELEIEKTIGVHSKIDVEKCFYNSRVFRTDLFPRIHTSRQIQRLEVETRIEERGQQKEDRGQFLPETEVIRTKCVPTQSER